MKKTIKDFLLKKRFFKEGVKVLRNKKGFSLIEVLVAVAIVGIISGIAVPQFLKHRENAARVAANTSASNIVKAFKQCMVLNSFSECDTLAEIDMNCPSGSTCADEDDGTNKFCAHILTGDDANNPDFAVCVSVSGASEVRTYGGKLIGGQVKYCHVTNDADCTDDSLDNKEHSGGSIKLCTQNTECQSHGSACSGGAIASRTCKNGSSSGKCNSTGQCI